MIIKVQLNDIKVESTFEGKEPKHHSPGFDYCRKLLRKGSDPKERLEIYRGDILAYSITSLGEGAKWAIREDEERGPEFKRYKASPYSRRANKPAA